MRLELSNRTGIARQVLIVLAGRDGSTPLKGRDLALAVGTSRTYLPQVVAPILAAGWITSDPGPNGGYRLADSAREATMLDLIEAIEGPIADGRCVLQGSHCDEHEPCVIHDMWARTRAAMTRELRNTAAIPSAVAVPSTNREV